MDSKLIYLLIGIIIGVIVVWLFSAPTIITATPSLEALGKTFTENGKCYRYELQLHNE